MDCREISWIIKKSNRYRLLFILAFITAGIYILLEAPEAGCGAGTFTVMAGAALWIFLLSWTYSEHWLTVSTMMSKSGKVNRGVRLSRIAQIHGFDCDEYFAEIARHQIIWVAALMITTVLCCIINDGFEEDALIYTVLVLLVPLIAYAALYLKKMIFQFSACSRKEPVVYDVLSLLVNLTVIIGFSWIMLMLSVMVSFLFDGGPDRIYEIPAKPVIYIYPEETMDVSVKVNINETGHITYTYPQYDVEKGWNVTAEPGSVLYDETGREYSYLFWEGVSDQEWDFETGFVVKGSDTVPFLQEKLEYLGLTPKEYNEFIVYWMPKMQDNEYNLISFQTEKYEEYAALEITPQPDSIQRVFMAYQSLDRYIEIPEQQLQPFERKGYTVIEWGGVEIQ